MYPPWLILSRIQTNSLETSKDYGPSSLFCMLKSGKANYCSL